VATVPIGYADGFHRAYTGVGALVDGVRSKVVGTVSMDNITIDLGPESTAKVGDEVVLIGRRGNELILAEDLALAADTINYEVATSVGGRTQRREVA
jgi:alanine racemase